MLTTEQFKENWERLKPKGQKAILLAVSGGVDSMVMATLFRDAGQAFAVGHCNFGLRGAASDGDNQLVREWCTTNAIPFHSVQFDTKSVSREQKTGTQETARNLRYEWLAQIMTEHQYSGICTAHHLDDNAETVLMNLARGTGIAGLHGILPTQGQIIRPMLFTSRKEIEGFAIEHNVAFRTDASNNTSDYTRNAIRHSVLPVLEEIMPGASIRIHETAQRIGEAELIYRKVIDSERKKLLQQRGKDYYIPIKLLRHSKPLSTIVYELIYPFGFNGSQIEEVLGLMQSETGRYISSSSHRIIHNRDFLIITTLSSTATDFFVVDSIPCEINTPEGKFAISESAIPAEVDQGQNVCYLDHDRIEDPIILRRWKIGDYFYPLGMGGKKKKLSRFFIDRKVPLHEKESAWVLESNKRIVWVCGMRIDDRFKLKAGSNKAIKVVFSK